MYKKAFRRLSHRKEKLVPEKGGSYSKLSIQEEAELIIHLEEHNYVCDKK